jgi:GNAT superfamily N-acetyltransferase
MVLIKAIDNGYCEAVIALVLPIQQAEFNVPVTLEGQPDMLDLEANYYKTGGCFWGAFINDELVGTIALISTGYNAGVIRKMFVKNQYRGKEYGIGQRLLDELVDYSYNKGITDLYLGTVEAFKAAQKFYEKNGFKQIEKRNLPHYFPFMPADTLFYHLHLKA